MGWRKASKDMTRIFNSSKEMKGRMGESLYSAPPLRPSGIFHLYQYFLFEFAGFVSKGRCRFPRLPRMQPVHTLGACGIPPTRDRGLSIVSVVLSISLFSYTSLPTIYAFSLQPIAFPWSFLAAFPGPFPESIVYVCVCSEERQVSSSRAFMQRRRLRGLESHANVSPRGSWEVVR